VYNKWETEYSQTPVRVGAVRLGDARGQQTSHRSQTTPEERAAGGGGGVVSFDGAARFTINYQLLPVVFQSAVSQTSLTCNSPASSTEF